VPSAARGVDDSEVEQEEAADAAAMFELRASVLVW
jgi:hypothetical protein